MYKPTLKTALTTATLAGVATALWCATKKLGKAGLKNGLSNTGLLGLLGVATITSPAFAISENSVQDFAVAMKVAANSQNIAQLARLIDDNAVISMTRQKKTTTLDKNAYLQLLQKSWAGASHYHYDIAISDVVVSGSQARATVKTVEVWVKDGKKTTLTTNARTTLQNGATGAVLLRSVSQITIE